MPWRQTPIPLELDDEENNSPVRSKICGSLIPDRIHKGTGLSHASNNEAPKEQSENFRADSVLNSTNSTNMERDRTIPLSSGGSANLPAISAPFTIRCNNCDDAIPDTHWHCSICDDADFDLCANCVEKECPWSLVNQTVFGRWEGHQQHDRNHRTEGHQVRTRDQSCE